MVIFYIDVAKPFDRPSRYDLFDREAACTPLASSIIADYFIAQQRALALGVYNWGIYIGYSMSYAVGNFVTLSLVFFHFVA